MSSYIYLPEFNLRSVDHISEMISESRARLDKVSVRLGTLHFRGGRGEQRGLFEYMHTYRADENVERPLFSLKRDDRQTIVGAEVRQGSTSRQGSGPLFDARIRTGGSFSAVPRTVRTGRTVVSELGQDDTAGSRNFQFNVSLNPTRWLAHQIAPTGAFWRDEPGAAIPLPRTFARRLGNAGDEWSLDGNDNVLLSQRTSAFHNRRRWRWHFERYWTLVNQHFTGATEEATPSRSGWRPNHVSVRQVETYWEFQAEDPLAVVASLEPHARAMGRAYAMHNYIARGPAGETGRDGNSLFLRFTLSLGREIAIYAKTNRRIRLEVRHDLTENASALGGRIASNVPAELPELISAVVQDASTCAQAVLRQFRLRTHYSGISYSAQSLLLEIWRHTELEADAHLLLSMLCANQTLEMRGAGRLKGAISSLLSAGVLVRPFPGRRTLCVADCYIKALQALTSARLAADPS